MNPKTLLAVVLCFVLLILAWNHGSGYACETNWFKGEGAAFVVGDDRAKARDTAVKAAGLAAVSQSLEQWTLDTLLAGFHLNGGASNTIPFVKIETIDILEENMTNGSKDGETTKQPVYTVKAKAAVCQTVSDPEANMKLSLSLDKSVYADGEEMRLQIRSSHDCRIAVYIITEDLGVARLIPSRLKNDNALRTNEMIVFPSKDEMAKGIRLRAHVAAEGKSTTETIFALALFQEQMEAGTNMDEAIFGLYDGQTASLKDLIARVAVIPLKHRSEYFIRYAIRTKS